MPSLLSSAARWMAEFPLRSIETMSRLAHKSVDEVLDIHRPSSVQPVVRTRGPEES
jgi:hypothetical protein